MARKKVYTTLDLVALSIKKNIDAFIKKKGLEKKFGEKIYERVYKDIFATANPNDSCKILNGIEKTHQGRFVVFPVIVPVDNDDLIEEYAEINRKIIESVIDELERKYLEENSVQDNEEIISKIKEKLCIFGDCEDDTEKETSSTPKKKRGRRGRPPKKKVDEEIIDEVQDTPKSIKNSADILDEEDLEVVDDDEDIEID